MTLLAEPVSAHRCPSTSAVVISSHLRLHGLHLMLARLASADCGADNEIKPKEPIRCKECGARIMYKVCPSRAA
jgi:hypothetical protein